VVFVKLYAERGTGLQVDRSFGFVFVSTPKLIISAVSAWFSMQKTQVSFGYVRSYKRFRSF